uniref:Retrovirus-related Pol polyprotein from transposon TNT 1-94 n=1 Tax=Cajanus cajan TaxID=3821 RepID=A0A151R4H9_CAJCA|nr:Retrovirus-related Pol polyprotein from transposon TNT 1-94 [Cajanus cajan]
MLVGEVEHWWRGTHHMLTARGVTVDWECFRKVFLKNYFPESVRHAKEVEFMWLHQGGLFVSEYAMRFEHLAHFYSQAIFEAWKCRKFAEGLKQELKRVVVFMAITKFPALVEKAKVVERLEGGNRVTKTTKGPAGSKRGGNQRKLYDRPQPQQGGPVIRQLADDARGGRQGGGATFRCYRCVGPQFVKDCPYTESLCFRCHQMGHESTNCPARNRPDRGAQRGDAQKGDRPTTSGRVFALTGAEASTSSDLMKGKGKVAGKDVLWTGKRPSLKHLHIWGCPTEARPYRPHESKLESRTVRCYFVGYPEGSRGYKFCNPTTRLFFEMGNARFLEDVEFGKEENIRNVVFEEKPVINSDQVLMPITISIPTSVIGDNHGVIPDIVPVQENIEVLHQIPIEQAQQPQKMSLRRSTREKSEVKRKTHRRGG